jgi:putative chitinase
MTQALVIARQLCRKAKPSYIEALKNSAPVLEEAGINTPLRLAHFLAQIFHETGALTIQREFMRYTAARIRAVWPSRPEAVRFAGDEEGLANSVYANRGGNGPPSSGDGFRYRGRGAMQTTFRNAYRRYGKALGVDFEADPDLILDPRYILLPAVLEWTEMKCNALADRNAIKQIGNAINRGNPNATQQPIGHLDRVEHFNRIWAFMQKSGVAEKRPSWEIAEPDPDIEMIQTGLVRLGYEIEVDGRKGPKTEAAIKKFQRSKGLKADGVAGPLTRTALADALRSMEDDSAAKAPRPDSARPALLVDAVGTGVKIDGTGVAGEAVLQQAEKLEGVAEISPWIRIGIAALMVIGTGLILYGIYRQFRPRAGSPR